MRAALSSRAAPREVAVDGPWPLSEPFRIGTVEIANRVVQAPLAGIANWAYRTQSRRHGAGATVSEMIASQGIVHGGAKTLSMLTVLPDEGPMGVQLFGADPGAMAIAARAVQEAGADFVDINMGCPVKKICRTGAGGGAAHRPGGRRPGDRGHGGGGRHSGDRKDAPGHDPRHLRPRVRRATF